MENTAGNMRISKLGRALEKDVMGRRRGIVICAILSIALMGLSLPFFAWITLPQPAALFEGLGLKDSVIQGLRHEYSLFNILSFVKDTKLGVLGLAGMLLLIVMCASLLLHLLFLYGAVFSAKQAKGRLKLYGKGQAAMLFSMVASLGTLFYTSFANGQFGMQGMAATPIVYIAFVLGMVGFILIKALEKNERVYAHEHGLITEMRRNGILFVMLVPCFIYFLINNYLPMVGVYFAFTSFNFRDGLFASPYVGFKNFEFLIKADLFRLTRNTVLYNLVFIGLGNVLQIVFAILISQVTSKWFKKTSQTMIFMPYFVSYVILKVLVYNIFEYDFGLINSYIAALGGDRIDFYNTPGYWPVFIVLFYLWKNLGYGMVVYLATIMGIDGEYYDAAKVDGANIFQQIRYITLPLLKPTFIILLLYALGSIMKGQFELFYQIVGNNGVLFNVTDIFDTYVYRITTTQPMSMGLGTAAGLYQSLFGFVVIVCTNFLIKRKNAEYALF